MRNRDGMTAITAAITLGRTTMNVIATIIATVTLALSGAATSPASANDWTSPPSMDNVLKVDGQRTIGYGFSVVTTEGVEVGYPEFRAMRRHCHQTSGDDYAACRGAWAVFYWQLRVFRDEHGGSLEPSWIKDAQPRP